MKDQARDASEHANSPSLEDNLHSFFQHSEVVINAEESLEKRVADVLESPFSSEAAEELARFLLSEEMKLGREAAEYIREEGRP
ncbi:hypothetical protein [Glutamicibacter nicotianae]|uniref:hypothetical protein n=1 Tax=Glutamicibacter nicotianae TaxID=37929 RepID=UPI000EF8C43A|nr:hypothetical protein [Glutamicibacter nicotianae]